VTEPGLGDLFRYGYERDATIDLEASYQDLRDAVVIHATEGFVTSTNEIGCTAAPGVPATPDLPTSAGVALIFIAIAARRRRLG